MITREQHLELSNSAHFLSLSPSSGPTSVTLAGPLLDI